MTSTLVLFCRKCFRRLHPIYPFIVCRTGSTAAQLKRPKPVKVQHEAKPEPVEKEPSETPRLNVAQIQMIPEELRKTLFGTEGAVPDLSARKRIEAHLVSKDLWGFEPQILTTPVVKLPETTGKNVDEHVRTIAEEQVKPYATALEGLLAAEVPKMPKTWVYESGWTRYNRDGSIDSVPFPDETAIVFDVETCMSSGKYATLAAALSPTAWYSWCSRQLIDDIPSTTTETGRLLLEHLIPLESSDLSAEVGAKDFSKPRIVVGHNVPFDRSYIREQYLLQGSKMRFFDTMSVHVAVAGFTNAQRALFMKYNAGDKRVKSAKEIAKQKAIAAAKRKRAVDEAPAFRRWLEVGSMNNLEDVYRLHCGAKLPYDKSLQDVFVKGTLEDVRQNFQALMSYCASDVQATHRLAQALYPQFREAIPHPASFSGFLEMSSVYLPVNENWEKYIEKSNKACDNIEEKLKSGLAELAREALELGKDDAYKDDMWLWDLDWSVQKVTKATKNVRMAKLPAWYRALCDGETADENGLPVAGDISLRVRAAPKLMRLTWNGWPLHQTAEHGWGWLEPLAPGTSSPRTTPPVAAADEDGQPAKKLTPAAKRLAEAVFPVHKLVDLAREMEKPLADPKSAANGITESEDSALHASDSTALTDAEWDQLSEMTPDQQQAFLATRTVDDLSESTPAFHKPPPSSSDLLVESDQEISRQILEQLELNETTERTKKKPLSKKYPKKPQPDPVEENAYYDVVPGCVFHRLRHANGMEHNVGSPLSRDFLQYFESGVLKASFGSASEIIRNSKAVSYWHNNKDRVESQLVGQIDEALLPEAVKNDGEFEKRPKLGAILPRVVPMGTVTRRAVEATWMTASNAKVDRIGSELKAMIQAPPGYSIVGADVDSQELWIAAVLGDAKFLKIHGGTAFGWMTLQGNKTDGTDLHSKTAAQAGISRDHAKIINYGRIYGAGKDYTALLLKNFNRDLSDTEAASKARKIFLFAKGMKKFRLNALGRYLGEQCGFAEEELDMDFKGNDVKQIWEVASGKKMQIGDKVEFVKVMNQLTEEGFWHGGSESFMFNMLESIARSDEPRTPVLGCRVSRSLLKENVEDDFMTSRVNWVVQSSAVDYLHIMLVCMKWLMEKYDIRGRFCLSIHDEVRYLVRNDDRYRCALALHLTNLFTRALFAHRLGMGDLPQSVAYFSAVDVDTVMRKEVSMDCVTPSNPEGLAKAYGVRHGETVNIYQALEKTGGTLERR